MKLGNSDFVIERFLPIVADPKNDPDPTVSGSASLVRTEKNFKWRGIVLWNVLLSQNVNSSRQGCGSLSFLIDPDSTSSFFKIQIFILRSGILNLKKNRVTLYFDLNFDFLYIFSVMMLEAEFLSSKQTTFSV